MDKDSDSGELTLSSPSKKLKQTQVALGSHPGNSSSTAGSTDSTELMNMDGSSSDLAYHDDEVQDHGDDDVEDLDYHSDYDDQDIYDDYEEFSVNDDAYSLLQSKFDNMDFPPGVEASVTLLTGPSSGKNLQETKTLTISDVPETEKKESATSSLMAHAESSSNNELDGDNPETEKKEGATKSLTAHAASSSNNELDGNNNDSAMAISQVKNFDVVDEIADHHYARLGFLDTKPPKDWAKKIQQEWKILENDLPDTIYVRVCEARMELLRAVIVGPSGTPYHDGLFVFDCLFPTNYPNSPPSVYYYSGGLRLNPNLYNCGKVCLSLLGTWTGSNKNENWVPGKSTMLQVLVSIQALILNSRPFFNEPGHETFTGEIGERRSNKYNEDVFILSLKTMVYTLRRPPKHFEELVLQHFRLRAHDILVACKAYTEGALVGSDILVACKAYTEGALVGSDIKAGVNNQDDQTGSSREFRSSVADMMNLLITSFSRNGAPGCEEFRLPIKK